MDNQETTNAPVGPGPVDLIREARANWSDAEKVEDAELRRGIQLVIMDTRARAEAKATNSRYEISRADIRALWGIGVPGDSGPVQCPAKETLYAFGNTFQVTSPVIVTAVPALGFIPGNIAVCSYAASLDRYNEDCEDGRVADYFKLIHDAAIRLFGPMSGPVAFPPKPNRT